MSQFTRALTVILIIILILGLISGFAHVMYSAGRDSVLDPRHDLLDVPVCHEDEVLQGYGDFDNHRWDHYRCVPTDNL